MNMVSFPRSVFGFSGVLLASFCFCLSSANSQDNVLLIAHHTPDDHHHHSHTHHHKAATYAPSGVRGDHMHPAGSWALSYRFMRMAMSGNRIGDDKVTDEEIVTRTPHPSPPPVLRVVPQNMIADIHMLGFMIAPNDRLTLMAMGSYIRKEMRLTSFRGMAGTQRLGDFTTRSAGLGDPYLTALIRLYDDSVHHLHLNAGISLPLGSIDKTGNVLTPMNTQVTMTLPYPMQIGSGSVGFLPGLTYTGEKDRISWGVQYTAILPVNRNKHGYRPGNRHNVTGWGAFSPSDWVSFSLRGTGWSQGRIKGRDPRITAPVQTAVPNFQGGDHIDLGIGMNIVIPEGYWRGHRLAFEFIKPIYQRLNGPQMSRDWGLIIGGNFNF